MQIEVRIKKPLYRAYRKYDIEDLVCSLFLSKTFKFLKGPQDSYWYWVKQDSWSVIAKKNAEYLKDEEKKETFSTFTSDELGYMLPRVIPIENFFCKLEITKGELWNVVYKHPQKPLVCQHAKEADARMMMVINLLEKDLIELK